MKKKYILFISISVVMVISITLLLLKNKYHFQPYTIVSENKQYVISATIPKTNTKLDNIIEDFIDKKIKDFKNNSTLTNYLIDRNELNSDYDYDYFNDRYISTILKIYEYSNKKVSYYVSSYFYDVKNNKILNVLDFFNNKEKLFKIIKNTFLEKENITISSLKDVSLFILDNMLYVYYVGDSLFSIDIPLTNLDFKINIDNKSVEEKELVTVEVSNIIDPNEKVVAITFDDGPSKYTEEIIETLKDNDCNATFFVLGNKVEAYQDILKKSVKYGNEIGNHTYNHKWLSRLSTNEIKEQITKTQNIISEVIGYTPTFLRPTYGSVNQRIRNNTDMKISLWTIDTKDWKIKNVDRIVDKAVNNIEDGDIILMHDVYQRTSDALKRIIPLLKEKGYQLVTLSELEEVKLIRSTSHTS